MQLHEESASALDRVGADLATIFQVLILLVLGYTSTLAWNLLRPRMTKVSAKKIDDVDVALDEQPDIGCEDELSVAKTTAKARNSNAKERKRMRKASRSDSQGNIPNEKPIITEEAQCHSPAEVSESVPAAPEMPTLQETQEAAEETQDAAEVSPKVSKLMAKKAERKAKKAQLQRESEQLVEVKPAPSPAHAEKADSEVSSQDGQTNLSPTASTPSLVSTGAGSSESDTPRAATELNDCSTPDSARSQSTQDANDAAPMKTKKKEQRARKAQAHPEATTAKLQTEVQPPVDLTCQDLSSTLTSMEPSSCLDEPPAPKAVEISESLGQVLCELQIKYSEDPAVLQEETAGHQEEATPNSDAVADSPDTTEPISEITRVNFDDVASDTDSDASCVLNSHEGISTPDELESPSSMSNPPVMWCSLPQGPGSFDENSQFPMMMPQIEGWVAVAVPTECAPPGAFDGLWKNNADEKILIEKLEIMFESGVTWYMEMHSLTTLSVEVDGEKVDAELDSTGEKLFWSDGDVWTFFGRVEEDPPQCAPCAPQPVPELPCMMMPFLPENMPLAEVAMPLESEWVPDVPKPAEKWEICWDWSKKGWCPRGCNCEWYHPMPETPMF